MTAYRFDTPWPSGHWIRDYIDYAAQRTDASHAYHEAAALICLAVATPNVRAQLAPYPKGLPTNLYTLIIGDSTRSRKSTAIAIAADVVDAAIPHSRIAEGFSPEAFVETLSERPRNSTIWAPDEFSETLLKVRNAKYMAGLVGLLLTIYSGHDYTARRHSKRVKGGDTEEDMDVIIAPNLSILAATTPAIFEGLTAADVTSGLLPRFAVVFPASKPPRRPFHQLTDVSLGVRNQLVQRLHEIYRRAVAADHAVRWGAGALEVIDDFARGLEESDEPNEAIRVMQQRLTAMTVKVAMLSAVGRAEGLPERGEVICTADDAVMAIAVVDRWSHDAHVFAERVGETEFESKLARCLALVRQQQAMSRRDLARAAHCPKRMMDDIEATLLDRGLIRVLERETHGRPQIFWALPAADTG